MAGRAKTEEKACSDCGSPFLALRSFSIRCKACQRQRRISLTRNTYVVLRAIADGVIPPIAGQRCVDCGEPAALYDHRDYAKPLDVQPVCVSCNGLRGAAKGKPNSR